MDLSCGRHGEALNNLQSLRPFEFSRPILFQQSTQFLERRGSFSLSRNHEAYGPFPQSFIRHTHDGHPMHSGMTPDHLLDTFRQVLGSPPVDFFLATSQHLHVAHRIDLGQITGLKPTVAGETLLAGFGILEIAVDAKGAFNDQISFLIGGRVTPFSS